MDHLKVGEFEKIPEEGNEDEEDEEAPPESDKESEELTEGEGDEDSDFKSIESQEGEEEVAIRADTPEQHKTQSQDNQQHEKADDEELKIQPKGPKSKNSKDHSIKPESEDEEEKEEYVKVYPQERSSSVDLEPNKSNLGEEDRVEGSPKEGDQGSNQELFEIDDAPIRGEGANPVENQRKKSQLQEEKIGENRGEGGSEEAQIGRDLSQTVDKVVKASPGGLKDSLLGPIPSGNEELEKTQRMSLEDIDQPNEIVKENHSEEKQPKTRKAHPGSKKSIDGVANENKSQKRTALENPVKDGLNDQEIVEIKPESSPNSKEGSEKNIGKKLEKRAAKVTEEEEFGKEEMNEGEDMTENSPRTVKNERLAKQLSGAETLNSADRELKKGTNMANSMIKTTRKNPNNPKNPIGMDSVKKAVKVPKLDIEMIEGLNEGSIEPKSQQKEPEIHIPAELKNTQKKVFSNREDDSEPKIDQESGREMPADTQNQSQAGSKDKKKISARKNPSPKIDKKSKNLEQKQGKSIEHNPKKSLKQPLIPLPYSNPKKQLKINEKVRTKNNPKPKESQEEIVRRKHNSMDMDKISPKIPKNVQGSLTAQKSKTPTNRKPIALQQGKSPINLLLLLPQTHLTVHRIRKEPKSHKIQKREKSAEIAFPDPKLRRHEHQAVRRQA